INTTGKSATASPCMPGSKHGRGLRWNTGPELAGERCRSVPYGGQVRITPSDTSGSPLSGTAATGAARSVSGGARKRKSGARPAEPRLGLVRRARRMNRMLARAFPDAHCELDFGNPLELAVATILSAQCTDVRVNITTPALFAAYPDARAYAE